MTSIYSSSYVSLTDVTASFATDTMSDKSVAVTIKASDYLDKGDRTMLSNIGYTFTMTLDQVKTLRLVLGDYLMTHRETPEPTINDIKRSIEETEGVNL
jgi:hypothetical protein